MAHKHIEFFERAFIDKLCDALASCIFAAFVLFVYLFLTATEACFGA